LAWSFAIVAVSLYIGTLGAAYGYNIATTRAQKHSVSIDAAMTIMGCFGVLWIIGASLILVAVTCLVMLYFIPARVFRINLFGYYRESDGQDLIAALVGNAGMAMIYAALVAAVNFAAMGLLTDMVHLFKR